MQPARVTTLALTAVLAIGLMTGCGALPGTSSGGDPTGTASSTAIATRPAPTKTTAPAEVVDPRLKVTIAGVTYLGTEKAPLKIGTDTPGKAPAAEATFPTHGGFAAIKPAAIAQDASKYTVIVIPAYAPNDFSGQGPVVGYRWSTFPVNEYGNWKMGQKSGALPSKQAAIDAPKQLDGRVLDRAEYVIAYY